ncbi:FlgN protein [Aquimixticola soesokkakensis]|uniref:FlgN protein n=1 Tax=Aquimixticola soesokkakensis TaxID=1519096 RepID=A0A1Y5RBW7_9RHOB|nr:hypothetical protein [Aquimixticola soesokkakensis]SLN13783.1 FlgN protein [Aquimixticola soesokkakensis]
MAIFERKSKSKQLEHLLDKEHAALMSGDFSTLKELIQSKTKIAESLQGYLKKSDGFERIKSKAIRNEALLKACTDGIKSAQIQISQFHKGPEAMTTYGPTGTTSQVGNTRLTMKSKV